MENKAKEIEYGDTRGNKQGHYLNDSLVNRGNEGNMWILIDSHNELQRKSKRGEISMETVKWGN